jgi:hypothetical protein
MSELLPAAIFLLLACFAWLIYDSLRTGSAIWAGIMISRADHPRWFFASLLFYATIMLLLIAMMIEVVFGLDVRVWL